MQKSEIIQRKFVDSIDISDYEIWTDSGWQECSAVHKTIEYEEWILKLDGGYELICADNHIVFNQNMEEIFVKELNIGDQIQTEEGLRKVVSVTKTDTKSNMYDVTVEDDNHRYYTNGILSHNTTTAVAVILHYILFNEHKRVALLANKRDTALEIMSRLQLAYESLPLWIQQGVLEWNKGSIELENGCKVVAASSSSSSIRGKAISLLYIDETAHLDNWEEFFSSVYPTISSGKKSKMLLTSTPNSLNHFWKICKEAQEDVDETGEGKNSYKYIEVKWDRVPGRDEKWKQETIASMSGNVEQFEQEFNCVTGDTKVTVRDPDTGEILRLTIEELNGLMS